MGIAAVWTKRYATGVRVIDEDHRGLFDLLAVIDELAGRKSSNQDVAGAIQALSLYTADHFEREERFMRRAHYPKYDEHKKIHDDFRALVVGLCTIHRENPEGIDLKKVSGFLTQWIAQHILTRDMEYIPFLNGTAPEDSFRPPEEVKQKLSSITLQVPEGREAAVSRFAALLVEGDKVGEMLVQALDANDRAREKKTLNKARKLFCLDV